MNNREYKLYSELLQLSESQNWSQAKLEWRFEYAYIAEEPETCLCGHFPIKEICTIYNTTTKQRADIGNHCIKQFLNIREQEGIFNSLKKIMKDKYKSVNEQTIEYAFNKSWINKWEYDFYLDIRGKRNLTDKQEEKKLTINKRIINGVRRHNNLIPT